jgi:hypothetical protein
MNDGLTANLRCPVKTDVMCQCLSGRGEAD